MTTEDTCERILPRSLILLHSTATCVEMSSSHIALQSDLIYKGLRENTAFEPDLLTGINTSALIAAETLPVGKPSTNAGNNSVQNISQLH